MDGVEDFLRELALEKLEAMRKNSLLEIGEKLELETRKTMRKEKLESSQSTWWTNKYLKWRYWTGY